MVVRKTLQWIATLLLLAGAVGGGYSYWFFTHSDEQLRGKILEFVAKKLPNARLEIGRAWFWGRKVHLQNVLLSAKGLDQPLARCAEIVVTLDGQSLSDELRVDIRAVHVVRPDIRIVRDVSGHWNWENILPLPEPDEVCPEVAFEDLQVGLALAHGGTGTSSFHVQQGAVRLVPSARRKFQVEADGRLPTLGDVHLEGGFDLDKRSWQLGGGTSAGANVADIVDSTLRAFPDMGERLAAFERTLQSRVQTVSNEAEAPARLDPAFVPERSAGRHLAGRARIQFELRRESSHDPVNYKVLVDLAQGEVDHPLLPFGLQAVAGKIYARNDCLILRDIEAQNGTLRLNLDGQVTLPEPAAGNRIDIKIADLPLDERLRSRLPASGRKLYDSVRPEGVIDAAGALICGSGGGWEPTGWSVTAKHCSASHVKFPYPISEIVGTAVQNGNSIALDLRGRAGNRPAKMIGRIVNPGPDADADFEFQVQQLPVDEMLLAAASAQAPLHKTLTALNLRGLMDVHSWFHHGPGQGEKLDWRMDGRLADGSLEYNLFPYRIADLSGRFRFDSKKGVWNFDELRGRHGPAQLSGVGSFVKTSPADHGTLKLEIQADDVAIGRDFQQAFPASSQKLWDLVYPTGKLKTRVVLSWNPGSKPAIDVPVAVVTDGSLEIRSFPYPLEHVTARFAYGRDPNSGADRILVLAFQGWHDATKIRVNDSGQSFILCPAADDPVGEWRIRLERLLVDDLTPDHTLRRALPTAVRNTVNALNPQGSVSLDGMLELRGTRRPADPVTAAWSFETIASGATISTGVELMKVNGRAKSWGIWDGHNVRMEGRVDLNSAFVWNHQFTSIHGPFELANQDLIVGSAKTFVATPAGVQEETIPDSERMTARFVGGTILLDAQAHLNADKTRYRVKAAVRNASLGEYARVYIPNQATLRGVMNGWIDLSANSPEAKDVTGRGQLLIHPAALYELPVFVQIFKLFGFAPPNNTAFNYALASFSIGARQFNFREIDLIGDAISLRGQGLARFDGTLRLNFYSRPAGAWQRSIFRDLANQFGQGWVGVSVAGTVQQPLARQTALPQMNDAFKKFLDAFNQRPGALPPVNPPWMNSFPMMPLSANPQPNTATH
jgi:hypothetical protein